ncbi:MAG: AAA family ATPase [Nanoarchaeota archaeon]|nr:AAA family ATPase [Nanoarchaeota archaeon]MBU4456713.1 AAA family ATPase [Nanoarchaeota archaeon]
MSKKNEDFKMTIAKKDEKTDIKIKKVYEHEGERVKTGIPGFDELVLGGIPRGKIVLLSGTPGTCKTIFGLQFLYNGATMFNEKGLFVTIEERVEGLKEQARQFGWDFDSLEKQGIIKLLRLDSANIKGITSKEIMKYAQRNNVKRLVLDSLSALAINTPNVYSEGKSMSDIKVMQFIYCFINDLKKDGMTTFLISQTQGDELSRDSVSEFTCDGIVYIKYENLGGEYSRHLMIRKMRETKHSEDIHPIEISKDGLILHKME